MLRKMFWDIKKIRLYIFLFVIVGANSAFACQQEPVEEKTELPEVLGRPTYIGKESVGSEAVGVSPAGHLFGLMDKQGTANPIGFSYDGKSKKTIVPVEGYKEFHAVDASDDGTVVGYCFVKKKGVKGPFSCPALFSHSTGKSIALSGKFGLATGISADGLRIVGVSQKKATVWQKSANGWSSTLLLGSNGEPVIASRVCVSPDGNTIAATGRFDKQRSRSLTWKLDKFNEWGCHELVAGSQVTVSIRQVNNAGICVGTITRANGQNVAVILGQEKGVVEIGGHSPIANSFGRDINQSGDVLVWSYDRERQVGVIFQNGKKRRVGFNGDEKASFMANGLTDDVRVVGTQQAEDETKGVKSRAFVWQETNRKKNGDANGSPKGF